MYRADTNYVLSSIDIELAQMTLVQNHDTPSVHTCRYFLCEVRTSNVSPYERYAPDTVAQTNRKNDIRLGKVIPKYLYRPNFVCGV